MKFDSAFVGDLSGSVGGLTASRARGGVNYFRFRTTPTNPRTQRQQTVRGAVANLTARWQTLTQTERQSWITLAQGSEDAGLAKYVGANVPRLQVGMSPVDEFDISNQNGLGPFLGVGNLGTQVTIQYDPSGWATLPGNAILFYLQRPVPPSRTFEQRFRLLGAAIADATTPPTSPFAAPSPWGQTFQPGDTSIIKVRGVDAAGRLFTIDNPTLVWS